MKRAGPVVIGIDGVAEAAASLEAAIDVAAWEAAHRNVELHVVYGRQILPAWSPADVATDIEAATSNAGHRVLAQAVARVTSTHPRLSIVDRLAGDGVAAALVNASAYASLVVVAADARVHYGGLLAGSVGVQVAAHAAAPVIIVPAPSGHYPVGDRRIVIGVDGSPGSADAMGFAFDEAETRGAGIHAVYAWELPSRHGFRPVTGRHDDMDDLQSAAENMVVESVARWRDKYPDTPVTCQAIRSGNPVRTLNDVGFGADLIVVGPRGHGGFATLVLGSVTDGLVRYSRTSVAVVHVPADGSHR